MDVTWRNYQRLGYERLTRGVYGRPLPAGMTPWDAQRTRFNAYVRAVFDAYDGKLMVAYGPTALQLLQVAMPTTLQDWDHCHVLVPAGSYRPVRRGVVAHSTRSNCEVWGRPGGVPVLHPVDHWLQLRGTDDELIEVADGLVRRKRPLITMLDFRNRLDELAGTPGARTARRLFRLVRPGTDSLYETRTRLALIRAGLPEPVVNYEVLCRSGPTYHVDMGYGREKLAVEYDGADHVGERRQMEIDALRRRDLQDDGWLIITVTAQQLHTPEATARMVRSVEVALVLRRAAGGN